MRPEKRKEIIEALREEFTVSKIFDLSDFEKDQKYLEGTGSLVIDHFSKTVYAALSPRTNADLVHQYALKNDFKAVTFETADQDNRPIYHTNVLMCVGEQFAVLCSAAIKNEEEKKSVTNSLRHSGRHIIEITLEQMNCFAGNMLLLRNHAGKTLIVLSSTAKNSLTNDQVTNLERFGTLLTIPVPVIEQVEGGSVRCMMAEIFLPAKVLHPKNQ